MTKRKITEAESEALHRAQIGSYDEFELPILMSDNRPLKHPVQKKRTSAMRVKRP